MLIACADLQDPSNPVVVTLSPWAELLLVGEGFLTLDGVLVRDEDVVVTEVFRAVDCGGQVSKTPMGSSSGLSGWKTPGGAHIRTKLLYLVISDHLLEGSTM